MKKKHLITTMILLVLLSGTLIGQKIQRIIIPDSTGTPWITNGNNIYYNSGNVGIGVTNPLYKLHIESNTNDWTTFIKNTQGIANGLKIIAGYSGAGNTLMQLQSADNVQALTVKGNGMVGIGTDNPEKVLDVVGQTRIKASINSDMLDVVNDAPANTVNATKDLIWGRYTNLQSNNPGLIRFTTWADGYKREIFQVRNNGYMFLGHKSTGNYQFAFKINVDNNLTRAFSIYNKATGSSVPEFMVYGNGKVYCREVTVTSGGWADNVFYPNYILPKLSETEKYISEQGHLPGIPSEKEIINNGLNTGKMLKKQMQKIEELTLYTIEQQKMIDELKKEVEKLKLKSQQ